MRKRTKKNNALGERNEFIEAGRVCNTNYPYYGIPSVLLFVYIMYYIFVIIRYKAKTPIKYFDVTLSFLIKDTPIHGQPNNECYIAMLYFVLIELFKMANTVVVY